MMDIDTIITNVVNLAKAQTSGGNPLFVDVLDYECRAMPPDGIIAAVYFNELAGLAGQSGMDSTTGSLVLNVRLYTSTVRQPYGATERGIVRAAQQMCGALNADFTLDSAVRNVDIFGASGTQLRAVGGYIPAQDGKLMRVITITLPAIVNDCWEQDPVTP